MSPNEGTLLNNRNLSISFSEWVVDTKCPLQVHRERVKVSQNGAINVKKLFICNQSFP